LGRRGVASAAAFRWAPNQHPFRLPHLRHIKAAASGCCDPSFGRHTHADGGLHPMSNATPETISTAEKGLIFYFRMTMAWTFLYAASHQVFVPSFTVVGFL
jgi:hypothetical protein